MSFHKNYNLLMLIAWCISLSVVLLVISGELLQIGISMLTYFAISAWGHVAVIPIFYKRGLYLEGFIFGLNIGIAIAALVISIIVYLTSWNLLTIFLLVTVIPLLIIIFTLTRAKFPVTIRPAFKVNIAVLLATLTLVTISFYLPLKQLGFFDGDKYLYAWLFGHDFIIRTVHVLSLSRGVPLEGYFYADEQLSYYWLGYIYPALLSNLPSINLSIQKILQLTTLLYSLTAASTIVIFLNRYVQSKKNLLILLVIAFISYSYSDLYFLARYISSISTGGSELTLFGYVLPQFSGHSHTIYRFFLVQPQATLGISIMLTLLHIYCNEDSTLYSYAIIGLLIGLLFGIDAATGIMIAIWFTAVSVYRFYDSAGLRRLVLSNHLSAYIVIGVVYYMLFYIQMYDFGTGKGALQFMPNYFALLFSPLYLLIEFGPMLILGAYLTIKLFLNKTRMNKNFYIFLILLSIALFFTFFVVNPTEAHFGLLKATRVIPICLLVLTSYLLEEGKVSRKMKITACILIIAAAPSLVIDNLIASDISNPSTFLHKSDATATSWIKENLPKNVVIQAEPNYPGVTKSKVRQYRYSLIPIFAERMTAFGEWKVSSQEHGKADIAAQRFHSITNMFSTVDIDVAIRTLIRQNIDYVYIGTLEKSLYPKGVDKFEKHNELFQKVYSNDGVSIYKVITKAKNNRT